MIISKISKFLAVTLLAGTSYSVFAAESAAGVAEHLNMLIDTTKAVRHLQQQVTRMPASAISSRPSSTTRN